MISWGCEESEIQRLGKEPGNSISCKLYGNVQQERSREFSCGFNQDPQAVPGNLSFAFQKGRGVVH